MTINDLKSYKVIGVHPSAPIPPTDNQGLLQKAGNVVGAVFPGKAIGEAVGTAAFNVGQMVQGKDPFANPTRIAGVQQPGVNPASQANVGAEVGDILKGGATVAGLKAPLPSSSLPGVAGIASRTAQAAGTFGAIGAVQGFGENIGQGKSTGEIAGNTAKSAAYSAVAGGAFNLLGEGIAAAAKKFGPSALEFTSGVPKKAIEQAAANPETAKAGLKMPVSEVRAQAETSLNSLQSDLNNEFAAGVKHVTETSTVPESAAMIPQTVLGKVSEYTSKQGLNLIKAEGGLAADFSKSAIVNPGEQNAVKGALDTVNGWTDFTPEGLLKLSQRVGAYKDFDSGGVTRSSAIVGKIYGAVNDSIKEAYPQLSTLRTNYSKNKEVLDTISDVLNATKDKVGSQQAAVTRLDNIFKENRDLYLNAIRHLSERSGTDILSLLAGGEFQKLLPGYIRGAGGAGAVGLGATFISPWAILLAPLFSPRGAGVIARNADAIGKTTSALVRTATTKTVPKVSSGK